MKTCTSCKQLLDLEQFGKRAVHKDGLQYKCKQCMNQSNKNYRQDNKDQVNKTAAQWRKDNAEKIKHYGKRYRDANAEKQYERRLKYRIENAQRLSEYNEQYRKQNLDKAAQRSNARRAKKLANGVFKIFNREIKKIYSSPCFYCGSKQEIHADHVIPISKGGRHTIGNLVPACRKCNQSKGSKLLIEWKSQQREKAITNVR